MLSDFLKEMASDEVYEKWKKIAAKDLKGFVKRTTPFRQLKVSNFYFYVDTKSLTYSIILRGVKPNAARSKAFGAPVDQREPSPTPLHVLIDDRWRTVTTRRKASPQLGMHPLKIGYYGVSAFPVEFFGVKQGKKVNAYGLVDYETAVPVYSDTGLVEWVVDSNEKELERILEEAGFKAINGGVK